MIGIICCFFMLNQKVSYIYTYLLQQLYSLACIYPDPDFFTFFAKRKWWTTDFLFSRWLLAFLVFFVVLHLFEIHIKTAFKWKLEYGRNFTPSSQTKGNKGTSTGDQEENKSCTENALVRTKTVTIVAGELGQGCISKRAWQCSFLAGSGGLNSSRCFCYATLSHWPLFHPNQEYFLLGGISAALLCWTDLSVKWELSGNGEIRALCAGTLEERLYNTWFWV